MEILVIGSEGFIGSHCIDYFTQKGDAVAGLDIFESSSKKYAYTKISRLSPELDDVFEKKKFDVVINAAGSGNVSYSMTHPLIDFEANVLDTMKILDALRRYQPNVKYIHFSSAAVYGNPVLLPIQETAASKPLSPYGWHKLISEQLCKEYTSLFKIKTAILRPFSLKTGGEWLFLF